MLGITKTLGAASRNCTPWVQWTTGAISFALFNLRTLSTIARDGIMEFMDESRHMLGPELWTQVSR